MKRRYNIALVPLFNGNQVTALSGQFNPIADQYSLGSHSLPHVTICQFLASADELPEIWSQVCDSLNQKTIDLVFKEFSCITFNNITFWVSLLPNNCDKLMEMNCIVADIIKNPVSKSYAEYDPHMTLISTKNKEYRQIARDVEKSYKPLSDTFVLSLGESDEIGQYTKMIYQYEARPLIACKL
ncbi:MAG: hypothetical protein K0S27_1683 [Gammaproteobacteria bacterium]|jgi:hypothetical protein|nr:hypothetical protein [Gammaproteobacteria bacterium]